MVAAALLCVGGALVSPSHGGAQESVSVNRYSPGVLPTDGFSLRRPQTLGHLRVAAQLHSDFSLEPLVFDQIEDDPDPVPLVETQLTTHTMVAMGVTDYGIAFIGMPVHVLLDGEALPGQPTATGFGAGDLYFGIGGGWTSGDGRSGGGGRMVIGIPTSEDGDGQPGTAGESTSTLAFELSGEMPAGAISLLANAGLRFRQDKLVGTTSFGDEMTFGFGAVYGLPKVLDIYLELVGTASTENVSGGATTSMEAGLGTKVHIGPSWLVGASGGGGIAPAYGTPIMRAILMLGWQMPVRPRPVEVPIDDRDPYELEPEPEPEEPIARSQPKRKGKPAAEFDDPARRDSDGDGMSDLDDRCPLVPGESAQLGCARFHTFEPETGHFVLTRGIAFVRRRAQLRSASARVLDEVAATLAANTKFHVRVEAHTLAGSGDTRAAMELSMQRAAMVAAELAQRGIASERIEATGCGQSRPIRSTTGSGRGRNERIEIWVTKPLPKAGMPSDLGCQPASVPASSPQ